MNEDARPVTDFKALLAAIDDSSLHAIIDAVDSLPATLPALQAWIEHAARWEYDRRAGRNYKLQGPMAALSPEEVPDALTMAAILAELFRREHRRDVSAVLAFFEGMRDTLVFEQRGRDVTLN